MPRPTCASWRRAATRCACRASRRIWCCRCRCRRAARASRRWRESTAVQLFVERAQAAQAELRADRARGAGGRRAGGAAGRHPAGARARGGARALASVADINTRLKDRYKLLTGGDRTLQARQQTLRALVDWSYDLLQDNEQILLARLAVFVGGFDLAAAEAICGADPLAADDVLDLVTSLVEKSLVQHGGGRRRRALSGARDDPRVRAREARRARRADQPRPRAHCDHFFAMAKAANQGLQGRRAGRMDAPGREPSSTTCAPRSRCRSRAASTRSSPSSSRSR